MAVNPRDVSQAAVRHLRRSPYPSVKTVSCDCERGVVLLRGRVRCYYHKQLAQEAVRGVEGVAKIMNEIEVVAPFCRGGDENGSHTH